MKYTVVFTHNPQDFYNGEEPAELSKSYVTANLEMMYQKNWKTDIR